MFVMVPTFSTEGLNRYIRNEVLSIIFYYLFYFTEAPAYLIDLMHDKNCEIRKLCDACLDVIKVRHSINSVISVKLPTCILKLVLNSKYLLWNLFLRSVMKSGHLVSNWKSFAGIIHNGWKW